jgi:hypothetical protein
MRGFAAVFHLELRNFPHQAHVFNLRAAELESILVRWRRGAVVELAGRKWVPEQARLTVLEGPELAPHELAMNRGWSAALRTGRDVTAGQLTASPLLDARPRELPHDRAAHDELTRELLALAREGPVSLQQAWRLADAWFPSQRAGERLALAEAAVQQLLSEGTAVLCRGRRASAARNVVPDRDVDPLLLALETWLGEHDAMVFLCASTSEVDGARPAAASPPAEGAAGTPPA